MDSETLCAQKLLGAVRTVIFSIHVNYVRNCSLMRLPPLDLTLTENPGKEARDL